MATRFRIVAALAGWFGLVLQYWLVIAGSIGPEPVGRTINFFSYFTILTNLIAALAMTLPWLAPQSAAGQFFSRPSVRTSITGYMIIVIGVVFFILRHLQNLQGWDLVADVILHYVTPVLFLIDWLFFVPKGTSKLRHMATWLAYPIAYLVWTVAHGAPTGFYPYPFLNVGELGFQRILANMAGLLVVFLLVGLLLIAADRVIGRGARTAKPPN
jgi:hypothetical protein